MSRSTFITTVSERSGVPAAVVDRVLQGLASVITESVASGQRLQIPGIATVDIADRAARTGRNPRTGEAMVIPARRAVKITPVPALRRIANGDG